MGGCFQRSSPVLFNIFLNDIFYFTENSSLFNYADDNCNSVCHKELNMVATLLEREGTHMVEWFHSNGMKANTSKFQWIIFSAGKPTTDICVNLCGDDIPFVSEITVLGVCIDEKLTFNEHIKRVCTKASRQISALQRLSGVLDLDSRKVVYKCFILANFDFCPLVWLFTSRKSISLIRNVEERALRFVLRDSVSGYDTLVDKANMDAIRTSTLKKMALEIYKILNGHSPEYLSSLFDKSDFTYKLRDGNRLVQPLTKTTRYGLKSLRYFGSHLWNIMPTNLKSESCFSTFKSMVTKWSGPTCNCSVCNLII